VKQEVDKKANKSQDKTIHGP